MIRIVLALLLSAILGSPAWAAEAGRRVALVIGNDAYQHIQPLEKAGNDARAVGAALEKVGFRTAVLLNANQRQLSRAINRFAEEVAGGGQAVFYFAGHGVQINNQNYLLPVDFELPGNEADVADQAIHLQAVQDKLAEVRAEYALMVIDACRDNPLPRRAGRSLGGTRGLAQPSSAQGLMVVFSAGAHQQALDKLDDRDRHPNGVFTREFLPWIEKPGVRIRDAILEVRRNVHAAAKKVDHDQLPAVYDQVLGDFYFVPPRHGNERTLAVTEAAEVAFWNSIQGSQARADYEDYLARYPKGVFAGLAQRRLLALSGPSPAPAKPAQPAPPAPAKAAVPTTGPPALPAGKPAATVAPAKPPAQVSPRPAQMAATATGVRGPRPGDAWEYEVMEHYAGNRIGSYRITVASVAEGQVHEQYVVNAGQRTFSHTRALSGAPDLHVFRMPNDPNYWIPDFAPYLASQAALEVGKTWPVDLPMGQWAPCRGQAEVKKPASVNTPMGPFEAQRVELKCKFNKPLASQSSQMTLTAWYVPEVGRVIRLDKFVPGQGDYLGDERESYVLRQYSLK